VKESTALSNKLVKQMQALTELQRNVSWADHANQGIEAGATTLGSQVRGSAQVLRRAPAEVRVHEAQQHSLKQNSRDEEKIFKLQHKRVRWKLKAQNCPAGLN